MRGARRRVVAVGVPFWLCLAAGLGTAPAARAVSLPSRPEHPAGIGALHVSAPPGPWVWRWLNPNAPAPFDENDALPPAPASGAGTPEASDDGAARHPFGPPSPAPTELPHPVAHADRGSDTTGGAGAGSSAGGGGPSQTGLPAGPLMPARPPVTRIPVERTVLLLTEHHDRVFRPPRLAGATLRQSRIVCY
jgi:hypothetical protein